MQQISQIELLKKINDRILKEWKRSNHHCTVELLKEVRGGRPNWEVDTTSRGGASLKYGDECLQLQSRVVTDIAEQYDVDWSAT